MFKALGILFDLIILLMGLVLTLPFVYYVLDHDARLTYVEGYIGALHNLLDKSLKAGLITQEEYDEMKKEMF